MGVPNKVGAKCNSQDIGDIKTNSLWAALIAFLNTDIKKKR